MPTTRTHILNTQCHTWYGPLFSLHRGVAMMPTGKCRDHADDDDGDDDDGDDDDGDGDDGNGYDDGGDDGPKGTLNKAKED